MKAIACFLSLFALPAYANTYYVRTDGGLPSVCDGTTNTAAPAAHCAWVSPMVALPAPPYGGTVPTPLRSGDTLMIGAGQYMIGYGAPGGAGNCNLSDTADCKLSPVPAGIDSAHPTRILGSGSATTQLWGTRGLYHLINLSNSNNVEIGGLELTDHSQCIVNHCSGSAPCAGGNQVDRCLITDSYANNGIASSGATNVYLHDLNIHGLGGEGMHAGNFTNLTMQNVRVFANGFAGIDMDVSNGKTRPSSNHGALNFDHLDVEWSGCGERYPVTATPANPDADVYGCWDQDEGGYGDGLGTAKTSGNWTFTNSTFRNNVSDGIDLLYGDGTDVIVVDNLTSTGNAGNQLKLSGTATITNSVLDGTCAQPWSINPPNNDTDPSYVPSQYIGRYNMQLDGNCRADGGTVALGYDNGTNIKLINNTIAGQGGCLIVSSSYATNLQNVSLLLANNILDGDNNVQWLMFATGGGAETVCGYYNYNALPAPVLTTSKNIEYGVKDAQCLPGSLCVNPQLTNNSPIALNPILLPTSPAIGTGDPAYCLPGLTCNIGSNKIPSGPPPCTWPAPPTQTPTCPAGGNQAGGTWQHGTCPAWTYQGGTCPTVQTPITCPAGSWIFVAPNPVPSPYQPAVQCTAYH